MAAVNADYSSCDSTISKAFAVEGGFLWQKKFVLNLVTMFIR